MRRFKLRWVTCAVLVMLVCGFTVLTARDVRAASLREAAALNDPDALLKLAGQAGFKTLTDCERKLLQAAPVGKLAVCGPNQYDNDPDNDPSKADQWLPSRDLRADLIRWLCVNEAARKLIDPQGIRIYGAIVIDSLDLESVSVPFGIAIVKSRILSPMSLMDASVEYLYLTGTWTSPITADRLITRGMIFLNDGFHAGGEVRLLRATVGGDLDCTGGTFDNISGMALNAAGIKVAGEISLDQGFNARGEVRLHGATVGRDLDCHGGTFSNGRGMALDANEINVAGGVLLRGGFSATGEVNLTGAAVHGILDCENGTFRNPNQTALDAHRIQVAGSVYLREGFKAIGDVNLTNATVDGDLSSMKATFAPGSGLLAERARVSGEFCWTGITDGSKNTKRPLKSPDVILDLKEARATILADDQNSWPVPNSLFLDGFIYQRFATVANPDLHTLAPHDAGSRLRWLRLQDHRAGLATEPYQQLASVLESEGDEQGARKVRIAMEDDLLPFLQWYTRAWRRILKYTVAYGYEPWIALYWSFGFVACGYILFALGYRDGVIAPTDKDAFTDFQGDKPLLGYQSFNAFVYSLDTFLPIINLGLKDKWMPNPDLKPPPNAVKGIWLGDFVTSQFQNRADWHFFHSGRALRVYFWIHLLLGWVLITLFAAGFTGIIRR